MRVVAYFPYLELGVAYYHLGQHDAALQAFETEERLGAIAESEPASAELDRFRTLATDARATAAAEKQQRIRRTVSESLRDAELLESQGLLVTDTDEFTGGWGIATSAANIGERADGGNSMVMCRFRTDPIPAAARPTLAVKPQGPSSAKPSRGARGGDRSTMQPSSAKPDGSSSATRGPSAKPGKANGLKSSPKPPHFTQKPAGRSGIPVK